MVISQLLCDVKMNFKQDSHLKSGEQYETTSEYKIPPNTNLHILPTEHLLNTLSICC